MKTFVIIGNNVIQDTFIKAGLYTFNATIKSHQSTHRVGFKGASGWVDVEMPTNPNKFTKAHAIFELKEDVSQISLCRSGASTTNPIIVQTPMWTEGNNISTPSPNPADLDETTSNVDIKLSTQILQTNEKIQLIATEEQFNEIGQGGVTAFGMIKVMAGDIELKVGKDGVISSINQSAEEIQINADRIRFTGSAEFEQAVKDIASEDVQAEIDAVQSNVNTVSTSVTNLNTYIDGAFKDGVISEAEAKAIEKYKNTINEAMAKAEASYLKVYANNYLEGTAKTALANAKINLWGQRDTLLSTINSAIADGKTTIAEKNAVDSAFNTFNNLMSAFQSALEEANKAIQKKLDDISKGYVDDLEFGGRNLFSIVNNGNWYKMWVNSSTSIANANDRAMFFIPIIKGGKYTINGNLGDTTLCRTGYVKGDVGIPQTAYNTDRNTLLPRTLEIDNDATYFIIQVSQSIADEFKKSLMFQKGNKATDWLPAPEDIQSSIDQSQADADRANALLTDIASDSEITPSEKQETKKECDAIVTEYPINVTQANKVSASTTAYTAAYNALNSYITPILSDLTTTSDIEGSTFRSRFVAYYTARTDLLYDIAIKIKGIADEVATVKNLIIYGDFSGEMKEIKSSNPVNYYPLGWRVSGLSHDSNGVPSDQNSIAPKIIKINTGLPKGMLAGLRITPKTNLQGIYQNLSSDLVLNEVHTAYVFARKRNASSTAQIRLKYSTIVVTEDLTTTWARYVLKFTPTVQQPFEILFNKTGTWTANDEVEISKIQLAQTELIFDYRPFSYIENAFAGSTSIEGGVVATNMVILNNEGGEIRSYVSGIDANPSAFAAGVTAFGTGAEKKNIDLRHDGSGHLASGSISWGASGNLEVTDGASIGSFTIENGKLVVTHSWLTYIGTTYVLVTQKTTFQSSGVLIEASYGGTTEHPQVVSWNVKIDSSGVTVGSMELRRDGLYKNGVKVL